MGNVWIALGLTVFAGAATSIGSAIAFVVLIILLSVLFMYIGSVMRFVFVDAVVRDRTGIREGWHEHKSRGLSYFAFQLVVGLLTFFVFVIIIGAPILLAVNAGIFGPNHGNAAFEVGLIVAIIAGVFLLIALAIAVAVVMGLTRDLVVPIMYVRGLGVREGWAVFWALAKGDAVGVIVYLLLKLVLAIGAGIAGAIVVLLGLVVLAIPLGIIGLIGYAAVAASHLTWSWYWLIAIIPTGLALLVGIGYYFNLLLLPIPVFFQAYALKFLGYLDESLVTLADIPPPALPPAFAGSTA